jgi:hypothetical protein
MTAYQKSHVDPYKAPEQDVMISEEYRKLLMTAGFGYDYVCEEENAPVWNYKMHEMAMQFKIGEERSYDRKTLQGVFKGTVVEDSARVWRFPPKDAKNFWSKFTVPETKPSSEIKYQPLKNDDLKSD